MKKEEAFVGAVVSPALLATLGFPERWNRGMRASSPESPGGSFVSSSDLWTGMDGAT